MKKYKLLKEFIFIHQDCTYTTLPVGFEIEEAHYDCRCTDCLKHELTRTEKELAKEEEKRLAGYFGNTRAIKLYISKIKRYIAHRENGGYVGNIKGKRWKEPYYYFVLTNPTIKAGQFDRRVVENNPDLFELINPTP